MDSQTFHHSPPRPEYSRLNLVTQLVQDNFDIYLTRLRPVHVITPITSAATIGPVTLPFMETSNFPNFGVNFLPHNLAYNLHSAIQEDVAFAPSKSHKLLTYSL